MTPRPDPVDRLRREWQGQVLFEGERWVPTGRFDHQPGLEELRSKAWNVASSRSRGTPLPTHVRVVTITYESGPAFPFQESKGR